MTTVIDVTPPILQICRELVTPGREADFRAIEEDAARICAELGTSSYKLGFHFHRDFNFGETAGGGAEVTFEVGQGEIVGPQGSRG